MGSAQTQPSNSVSIQNSYFFDYESYVSDDILIDIFSFVPDSDLLQNCRLVCKNWKEIIDEQYLWRLKCEKENFTVPKCPLKKVPDHFYRSIYLHQKYETNFIINPCGDQEFHGWKVLDNGGDQFVIENPPKGCDPVPAEVGSNSCFATSYQLCRKIQDIDLWKKHFHKFLLQHDLVKLCIGEWYAARFDCGSEYKLYVSLMNNDELVDEFNFEFNEEQWAGREWHLVTHEFENLSKVQFVHFQHAGQDTQFWAGNYGSKMTGAFVKLVLK